MRYNAFFGELPLNAFKPRPGGGMTLEGGGNPISAVTNAVSDVVGGAVNTVGDVVKGAGDVVGDAYMAVRDPLEAAAVVAGNYYLPGSSLVTSKLVSDNAQEMLNTDAGKLANLAAGGTGAYQGNLANYGNLTGGTTGTEFTGELPNGYTGYQDPNVTTIGNVAGPTEGMASGTSLSGLDENAYTAAQDAQDALAMTGNPAANASLTGIPAIAAGTMYPAANAAATGSSLSSMLPYIAGGQAVTGLLQANSAKQAADIQSAAAQNATALQGQMFNTINQQQAPYRTAGYGALNQIGGLGGGQYTTYDQAGNPTGTAQGSGYLTHQFDATDLQKGLAPNYDFMLQQGQMANQRAANAGGGALGGNALQGLNKYTQDYAGNAYQNAFTNYQNQRNNIYNTLAGIAGIGQTGQTATNTAGTNATNAASQLGIGSAAAQAAGQVGSTNALANTVGNIGNTYMLSQLLGQSGRVA